MIESAYGVPDKIGEPDQCGLTWVSMDVALDLDRPFVIALIEAGKGNRAALEALTAETKRRMAEIFSSHYALGSSHRDAPEPPGWEPSHREIL